MVQKNMAKNMMGGTRLGSLSRGRRDHFIPQDFLYPHYIVPRDISLVTS